MNLSGIKQWTGCWQIFWLFLFLALSAGAQQTPVFAPPKKAEPTPAPGGQAGSGGEVKPGFYGIDLQGTNIAFLLDNSGSMAGSRLQIMKAQLHNIFEEFANPPEGSKLSQYAAYKIWVFNSSIDGIFPENGFVRVGDRNSIVNARQFVASINTGGGTSMLGAWRQMLDWYGDKFPPDTIYFLSDGDSSDCRPEELLEFLRQRNKVDPKTGNKRMVIHCVSVGQRSQLLMDIAEQNRGRYIEAR